MYKTDLIFFKIKQGDFMNILSSNHSDIFSIATLIYTRLRRVSGRVIDVMYMESTELLDREVTKEPDDQAQVAHHYIGALR